jgi:hypothetical protein
MFGANGLGGLMRKFALAAAAIISLTSCATTTSHPASKNRDLITADEIANSNASNAYEAIERLRPAFLRTRGSQSLQNTAPPSAMVYLDGMRYGPVTSLAQIPAMGVISIQYMSALEASQRFGLGNEGGAILVATKH